MGEQADYLLDEIIDDHFAKQDILEDPTAPIEDKLAVSENMPLAGLNDFMSEQSLANRKKRNDAEWEKFFGKPIKE